MCVGGGEGGWKKVWGKGVDSFHFFQYVNNNNKKKSWEQRGEGEGGSSLYQEAMQSSWQCYTYIIPALSTDSVRQWDGWPTHLADEWPDHRAAAGVATLNSFGTEYKQWLSLYMQEHVCASAGLQRSWPSSPRWENRCISVHIYVQTCICVWLWMIMYGRAYVHIMRLYVLYDYVQCCEDTVSVELCYIN